MGSDPRLMALPALRKRAEEQARDLFVARYTDAARGHRDWAEDDNERELCIRAHLALLCDLTRPESRRELTAMVAEVLGMPASYGAVFEAADVPGRCSIVAGVSPRCWHIFAADDLAPHPAFHGGTRVPSLAGVAYPTELLTLVAVAVLGGAS